MNALAIGTIGTTLAALTSLVILLFWTASNIYANNDGNDNNNSGGSQDQWWEFDMDREGQQAFKVVLNVAAMGIACATLLVPMARVWHPSKGTYDRLHLGALAASTFLVGNMLFVSFWYSTGFVQGEEENGSNDNGNDDNDDGNNDDDRQMDEEELLAYHQNIVSFVSLGLALVLSALAICIFAAGTKLPERGHDGNDETHARVKSAAHTELFAEMWKLLSVMTAAVLVALFLIAVVLSLGEEGERRREEGGGNLAVVLFWMAGVTVGASLLGGKILSEKTLGTLGVGAFCGGTAYYTLLLFVVSVLFANPTLGGPGGEGGPAGTVAAVACFFLSLMHLAFSLGVHKYQNSMVLDAQEETDEIASVEFRRMEDDVSATESATERRAELT